ncbi:MAG: hypothetical protein HQ523_02015 [Lentisphaerae bacterium]|nr:hypothetical protein [Lentisphaerota bacterium]
MLKRNLNRACSVAAVLVAVGAFSGLGAAEPALSHRGLASLDGTPIRVCAIIESRDSGVLRAGFIDDHTGRSFVLGEGAFIYGYKLTRIDKAEEKITLVGQDKSVVLFLSEGHVKKAATSASAPAPARPAPPAVEMKPTLFKNPELESKIRGDVTKTAKPPPGFEALAAQ